jgi:hypothetical protein
MRRTVLDLRQHISGDDALAQLPLGKSGFQPGCFQFLRKLHAAPPGNFDLPPL